MLPVVRISDDILFKATISSMILRYFILKKKTDDSRMKSSFIFHYVFKIALIGIWMAHKWISWPYGKIKLIYYQNHFLITRIIFLFFFIFSGVRCTDKKTYRIDDSRPGNLMRMFFFSLLIFYFKIVTV